MIIFFSLAPCKPPTHVNMSYDPFMLNDIFNFTWKPVEEELNGILRGYEVRWKQVNSSEDYFRNITNSITNSNRSRRSSASDIIREIRLTNLSLYTNYSFEVAAITVAVGKFSDKYYFMSQEGGKHFLINLAIHFWWILLCFVVLAAMRICCMTTHFFYPLSNVSLTVVWDLILVIVSRVWVCPWPCLQSLAASFVHVLVLEDWL